MSLKCVPCDIPLDKSKFPEQARAYWCTCLPQTPGLLLCACLCDCSFFVDRDTEERIKFVFRCMANRSISLYCKNSPLLEGDE